MGHQGHPALEQFLPERAAGVDGIAVEVGGGDDREEGLQVRRPGNRRQHLDDAQVRAARHADLAIRPRLHSGPLDRIKSVIHLGEERCKLPARLIPAPRVLDDDRVVRAERLCRPLPRRPVVRRANQDHGPWPLPRRQVDVGDQLHAVAHGDRDPTLDADRLIERGGAEGEKRQQQEGEGEQGSTAVLHHWALRHAVLRCAVGPLPCSMSGCCAAGFADRWKSRT